jgi:hypothetical protein
MLQLGKKGLNSLYQNKQHKRERERERERVDEGILNQSIHSQTNKQTT